MRVPQPSAEQVQLLRIAYLAFRDAAEWPTVAYVDSVLDRDHDLDMDLLLASMPDGIVKTDGNYASPGSLVAASVAGLRFVEESAEDLETFVAIVRRCADLERSAELLPSGTGTFDLKRSDLAPEGDVPAPNDRLVRSFRLVQNEAVNWGSSGPDERGDWTVSINRFIRPYRNLKDVDDYLARRSEPPSRDWTPPPTVDPYAFVLMPFGEIWSSNVNDAIRQACTRVGTSFPDFTVERADEITEPGRITDQIVSAIERADVLIADITGSNANVMFELGYGDALGKPIIVLNQSVDDTPFDIRDWRQIVYSPDGLQVVRERLAEFITGTLLRLGYKRATAAEDDSSL